MTLRASVVVPVYDGAATIEGCLASLDAQTLAPESYEVIVVDDGSRDETADLVSRFGERSRARIALVVRRANGGPAAARNTGLAVASAPVVAFTDADCEVAPDWLERGLERLESESDLAGLEGRTDPKGETGTLTHQMRNESGGLWMTCNMFYRRAALAAVGGFDERFRAAFLEDSDVAFAVFESGGDIAWEPRAIVRHLVIEEGRRKFWRDARKRFYNPLLFRKHPELYLRHLRPVVPGLPELHLQYMAVAAVAIAALAVRAWIPAAVALALVALFLRRLAHAYRARDPISLAQVALVPFVQTFWVVAGAIRFRTFSLKI